MSSRHRHGASCRRQLDDGSLGAAISAARRRFDSKAIVLILGGLAALIAIIGLGGGFIPATAILFAATATALLSAAAPSTSIFAIGLVLAVVVFLLFDKLLTLSLPAGPLERLF